MLQSGLPPARGGKLCRSWTWSQACKAFCVIDVEFDIAVAGGFVPEYVWQMDRSIHNFIMLHDQDNVGIAVRLIKSERNGLGDHEFVLRQNGATI